MHHTCMKHARSGKHNHWPRIVNISSVKRFDVSKVKHIPVNKGFPDLLICPGDKHFVVMICLQQQKCKFICPEGLEPSKGVGHEETGGGVTKISF